MNEIINPSSFPAADAGMRREQFSYLIGETSGDLTVKDIVVGEKGPTMCLCECKCGRTRLVLPRNIRLKYVKSCGKCGYQSRQVRNRLMKNLVGREFGDLVVIEATDERTDRGRFKWRCRCKCGNTTLVTSENLVRGYVKSCGQCGYQQRIVAEICRKTKRKYLDDIEHQIVKVFYQMKQRCYNPNNEKYPIYGARGIYICDEWLKDPVSFVEWALKTGYKPGLTIERENKGIYHKEQNGPYAPWNCCWATKQKQANNRRTNHYIEVHGTDYSLADCARMIGVSPSKLSNKSDNEIAKLAECLFQTNEEGRS